ncbi:MAG TPA: VWA domain-containing protein [Candidatus Acidoferrales bacterium]|nr:VWA domain-containing protein [Candidatus Acidoferrales bacterium]
MSAWCSDRRKTRRGYILLFSALTTIMILVPAAGLAIDLGLMYLVQTLLSASTDAAVLAGARALSRGSDDATQHANAQATANAFFQANFPNGYLNSSNLQVSSLATTDSTYMRSVATNASVVAPLVFMRVFGVNSVTLHASSTATRRDVNVMIIMDRSGSLANSGSCTPLKAAAVNFVEKFSEGRDNLGLITFATSSRVDNAVSGTFKTQVESTLNSVVCTGATSSAQALWQGYQQLVGLAQQGALNAIVFFTDGRPTAVTESFPIKNNSNCSSRTAKLGVLTLGYNGTTPQNSMGLYNQNAPAQPFSSDLTLISSKTSCAFASDQTRVSSDVQYAPATDYWGNSLTATAYRSTTTSGAGLDVVSAQNVENFSTNAADHAALRIRRGDPDPSQGNKSLSGVTIYTIGLGDVDDVLLKRIANDPSLSPNPVAAGNQGRYIYAADATALDLAFTRVASQILRLAQ